MLIDRSFNTRAIKDMNKNTLPVYWPANAKAWVTGVLFKDWFLNCFAPKEHYLKHKNLNFKLFLIIDNSPGHPRNLNNPNTQVLFH